MLSEQYQVIFVSYHNQDPKSWRTGIRHIFPSQQDALIQETLNEQSQQGWSFAGMEQIWERDAFEGFKLVVVGVRIVLKQSAVAPEIKAPDNMLLEAAAL